MNLWNTIISTLLVYKVFFLEQLLIYLVLNVVFHHLLLTLCDRGKAKTQLIKICSYSLGICSADTDYELHCNIDINDDGATDTIKLQQKPRWSPFWITGRNGCLLQSWKPRSESAVQMVQSNIRSILNTSAHVLVHESIA